VKTLAVFLLSKETFTIRTCSILESFFRKLLSKVTFERKLSIVSLALAARQVSERWWASWRCMLRRQHDSRSIVSWWGLQVPVHLSKDTAKRTGDGWRSSVGELLLKLRDANWLVTSPRRQGRALMYAALTPTKPTQPTRSEKGIEKPTSWAPCRLWSTKHFTRVWVAVNNTWHTQITYMSSPGKGVVPC